MPQISSLARKGAIYVLALVSVLFPLQLQAAPEVILKITSPQVASILRAEGYSVEVDSDGDVIWRIEGKKAAVFVRNEGTKLNFYTGFKGTNVTLEKVNEWNRTKSYSKSYLDKEGDPVLELDLDLTGGVTRARIVDYARTCTASLSAWIREVVQ